MESITTDIRGCARCGGDHRSLLFFKLRKPVGEDTHWTMCPNLTEPILMRVVEADGYLSTHVRA